MEARPGCATLSTMSAVVGLSGESIAKNSQPVEFPDFTRGKWKTTKPKFAVDGREFVEPSAVSRTDDGMLVQTFRLGMGEPRYDFKNARVSGLEPAGIHIASGNEPRLKQEEGMFFACSEFVPHPVVQALADERRTRKVLVYQGRRFIGWPGDELWKTQKWMP